MTYGLTSASSTLCLSVRSDVEVVLRLLVEGADGVGLGTAAGDIVQ